MLISNCCSAPLIENAAMCSECKEGCESVTAECECGTPITIEQEASDGLCDRCHYLSTKC
jgi:hypothetical protein